MIFALATDENTLFVFATAIDAIAYCEGIDVEDGGWRFWDIAGNALAANFLTANIRSGVTVGSGSYHLVPVSGQSTLGECLSSIGQINDNSRFPDISAVRRHLASVAQVSQHGL